MPNSLLAPPAREFLALASDTVSATRRRERALKVPGLICHLRNFSSGWHNRHLLRALSAGTARS
jgi:hypothetical protein